MEFEKNRFNMFGIGAVVLLIAAPIAIWYTNPELITSWLKKESINGQVVWQAGPPPVVIVYNKGDIEWKDVKVTLNKNSVSQRYEVSIKSVKKHPKGFHIPMTNFKKDNGEVYDVNMGEPHSITVEVTLPDEKKGSLEAQLGGKKI